MSDQPKKIVAEIRLIYDGSNLMMHGPVQDKIMCLGMLELAKAVVMSQNEVQKKVHLDVIPPNGHITN